MKHIVEQLGKNLKDTYKGVSTQTHKTIDNTKCRTEILSCKNELKKLYQQLGESCFYQRQKLGEAVMLDPLVCDKIENLLHKIEELEKTLEPTQSNMTPNEIKHIKLLHFCPNCYIGNAPDTEFCTNCGTKID
ncbi:MAG: hypothetical protein ATN36_04380 [Epulopiscium sp. Nele67-Bin005]|nr:MAG: hypothetical protein ATN36_04380 [Epulopiscium sp. Nele67-Bin005]